MRWGVQGTRGPGQAPPSATTGCPTGWRSRASARLYAPAVRYGAASTWLSRPRPPVWPPTRRWTRRRASRSPRHEQRLASEAEPHAELDVPWLVRGRRDPAYRRGRRDVRCRQTERRMVQDVEELRAQLQGEPVVDGCALE